MKMTKDCVRTLLDLVVSEADIFDSSRYESYYPMLKEVCEYLVEGGLGDKTVGYDRTTTPRKLLAFVIKELP